MSKTHPYSVVIRWTGNTGSGTSSYRSYGRQHEISGGENKPPIAGSSDPIFRGDASRWNPEELLVAALSACHQLSYLHLCAEAGVVVIDYTDNAEGVMELPAVGEGRFTRVILHPHVTVSAGSDVTKARELHEEAHHKCFIANSVNFPVENQPIIDAQD